MPVYETAEELRRAEAAGRRARAAEAACKATGRPCQCVGAHHDADKHRRGLHLRTAGGVFHSGIRQVAVHGCRWCGLDEPRHCGGAQVGSRDLHPWEQPTPAQLRARCIAAGLDPDAPPAPPRPLAVAESACTCDEDAEPCGADDCQITFLWEIGRPH
ncbi:hypothetical protein ACIP9H_33410 [Streptomyces sp. NPDC088732]|uniref:hypothetical protein n=1 Tax=Streptomyces sp. NPDC088732 TaxID=3365879 RepID=UPI0037FE24E7